MFSIHSFFRISFGRLQKMRFANTGHFSHGTPAYAVSTSGA